MSVILQTNNLNNPHNNQQLNQERSGNLLHRAICWLKEPGEYEFARKVLAFAAAFFLCLTVIGIPFVVEGVREWNKNTPQVPISTSASSPNNTPIMPPANSITAHLQTNTVPPPTNIVLPAPEVQVDAEILFKSLDFSQIPQGIHYDLFNDPEKSEPTNEARKAILAAITDQLAGEKDPSNLLNLGKNSSLQG